jgi:hypothetical protein
MRMPQIAWVKNRYATRRAYTETPRAVAGQADEGTGRWR